MLDLAAIADLDAEMNRPDADGNGTAAAAGACRSHVTIEQKAKVRNDFDRGSMSLHKYGSSERTCPDNSNQHTTYGNRGRGSENGANNLSRQTTLQIVSTRGNLSKSSTPRTSTLSM